MPAYDISKLTIQVAFDTSRVAHGISVLENQANSLGRRMTALGSSLSFAVSAPIQLLIAGSLKAFADIDNVATRTMSRIAGSTREAVKELEDFAVVMSKRIPLSAKEIEEATDQITRMGGNLKFAKAMTEQFGKFATVLQLDVREATDVTVRILKEMGMVTGNVAGDMQNLNDIMDKVVVTMEATGWSNRETLEAFQASAALAHEMKLSLDDLTASMVMWAAAGKEGRDAGTAMNMVLRSLMNAYANYGEVFKNTLGRDLFDKWNTLSGMEKFIAFEKQLSRYNDDAQRRLMTDLGIQPRQQAYVTTFLAQLPQAQDAAFLKRLRETNVVGDRFVKVMESAQEQLKILWNQFVALAIAIGHVVLPPLNAMIHAIFWVVDTFVEFANWIGSLPFGIGKLATAIGRLTTGWLLLGLAIVGPMVIMGGVIASFFTGMLGYIKSTVWALINFRVIITSVMGALKLLFAGGTAAQIFSFLAGSTRGTKFGTGLAIAGAYGIPHNMAMGELLNALYFAKIGKTEGYDFRPYTSGAAAAGAWAGSTFNRARSGLGSAYGRTRSGLGSLYAGYLAGGGIGGILDSLVGRGLERLGMWPGRAQFSASNIYPGSLTRHFVPKPTIPMDAFREMLYRTGGSMIYDGFFRKQLSVGQITSGAISGMAGLYRVMASRAHYYYTQLLRYNWYSAIAGVLSRTSGFVARMRGNFSNFLGSLAIIFDFLYPKIAKLSKAIWSLKFAEIINAGALAFDFLAGKITKAYVALISIIRSAGVWGTLGKMGTGALALISSFSMPVWGWIAVALTAVAAALWALVRAPRAGSEMSQGMIDAMDATYSKRGGYIDNLFTNSSMKERTFTMRSGIAGMYLKRWKTTNLMKKLYDEENARRWYFSPDEYFTEEKKKEVDKHRSIIDKMLKEGAPIDKFGPAVEAARNAGALENEAYEDFKNRIQNATESGLTNIPASKEGLENYQGKDKDKKASIRTFSATTFGTAEEYKARVTGQQALYANTTGMLEQMKYVHIYTKQTAANTGKPGGGKPAGFSR